MAIQLQIKSSKPYIEKIIQAKGLKDNITIGVKVYSESEINKIRKEYMSNFSMVKLNRLQKQLEELKEDINSSETDFDIRVSELETLIADKLDHFENYQIEFCKKHILFIKNASLSIIEDGIAKDLLVADTREAKPIESLWASPEECLVALLDIYLENIAFKDSLFTQVPALVFNTDSKGEQLKN